MTLNVQKCPPLANTHICSRLGLW